MQQVAITSHLTLDGAEQRFVDIIRVQEIAADIAVVRFTKTEKSKEA